MKDQELYQLAKELRTELLHLCYEAQIGGLAGSLSVLEILISLYFGKIDQLPVLKYDAKKPGWDKQDYLLFSKGHCSAALYCVLEKAGFLTREQLNDFGRPGALLTRFPHHKIPGIRIGFCSPGQGLSVANGMAKAFKMDKKLNQVFVILGDGELQEGQIWEAAMSASHFQLDNLCAIIDYNQLQQDGHIKGIKNIDPLQDKFEAFGWKVFKLIDGHNFEQILKSLKDANKVDRQPAVIIAPTIKNRGLPFAENKAHYHQTPMSEQEMAISLQELEKNQESVSIITNKL